MHHGRAVAKFNGNNVNVLRLSYETYVGCIPAGYAVCRSCDTIGCVNPDHAEASLSRNTIWNDRRPTRVADTNPDKKCNICHVVKDKSEFGSNKSMLDGLSRCCKLCMNAWKSRWYRLNTEKQKSRVSAQVDTAYRFLFDYLLDHPCVDCGEKDPVVLEFDHLGDKLFGISTVARHGSGMVRLRAEMAKCEVRCANCHRRVTCKRINSRRWRWSEAMKNSEVEQAK